MTTPESTPPGFQSPTAGPYRFGDLLRDVLSPGALGTVKQLDAEIRAIWNLPQLLETPLPLSERTEHVELLETRIRRITRMLPADVSPMPNEVFTAIEFLSHVIHREPINIGVAFSRLDALAHEIRCRPLLHDLVLGRAN